MSMQEPETSVQEPADTEEAMVSPADEGDGGRETSNEINESEIQGIAVGYGICHSVCES